MGQRTRLAPCRLSRYGNVMSSLRLSAADALLRLWVLAQLALAGLSLWLAWGMRDWPADLPAPQPLRAVAISEFMAWFIVVPAAVVVWLRWRTTRDRLLAMLALAAIGPWLWSLLAWDTAFEDGAAVAGEALRLRLADAGIALAWAAVALRALRLR